MELEQYMEYKKQEIIKKYPNINLDINNRWENGIPHHKRSTELFDQIATLDFVLQDDHLCWKSGGDGDNGESLMYLLDIIFENEDQLEEMIGLKQKCQE